MGSVFKKGTGPLRTPSLAYGVTAPAGPAGQQPQPQPLLLLLLPHPQPQLPQLPHSRNRMMMAMMIHQQQEEP